MENKSTIKVSIIVPAYNVEGYIYDCLKSLVSQTMQNIEIIVINDGSTDNTEKIISEFEKTDSRIIVIRQENQGISVARNNGINIAKGEYLGFVDSDDYVDNDYFEKLYNIVTSHNADMAVASILKHKKNYKRFNAKYKNVTSATLIQDKIKLCQNRKDRFFYVWNKIYKTDFIKKHNITFPAGRVYEDVSFSMHAIFHANKIVSTPNTKYHYIERSTSIVKAKDKTGKKRRDHILAYEELQEFAHKHNFKLPERLNYVGSYWKTPLIKIYHGVYKKKLLFLGLIPILIKHK